MTQINDEMIAVIRHFGAADARAWSKSVDMYEAVADILVGLRGKEIGTSVTMLTATILTLAAKPGHEADCLRVVGAKLIDIADGLNLHSAGKVQFGELPPRGRVN
jgi:hypothetical protein